MKWPQLLSIKPASALDRFGVNSPVIFLGFFFGFLLALKRNFFKSFEP